MTQEDKQLLLADLGARLPYGVMCHGITYFDEEVTDVLCELHSYKCCYGLVGLMDECDIESIKPYLRPMSSITEEELEEFRRFGDHIRDAECKIHIANYEQIDWLKAHHFDYRGLIEKSLALEAPEGMYKEEQQ